MFEILLRNEVELNDGWFEVAADLTKTNLTVNC